MKCNWSDISKKVENDTGHEMFVKTVMGISHLLGTFVARFILRV